jgi:hypothetical protein
MDDEREWLALDRNQSIVCLCDGVIKRKTHTEFGLRMESHLNRVWHYFLIFVSQKRN